jgi:hypothetical protein
MREQAVVMVQKAQMEYENYRIFREIKDTERNRKLLDTFFPPETGTLTYAAFSNMIKRNPELVSRFDFRANAPLLAYFREEKERGDAEAQGYRIFTEVCEQLGASSIADVAPNQANWSLVKELLNNLPATGANITKTLTEQKGFAKNPPGKLASWRRDKELKERSALCRTIASDYSLDPDAQENCFKKHMTSPTETLETLRAKVQDIELRRGYRSMPKESLAAVAKAQTEQRGDQIAHKLPVEITAQQIKSWSAEKMRRMVNYYGFDALNKRLRETKYQVKE